MINNSLAEPTYRTTFLDLQTFQLQVLKFTVSEYTHIFIFIAYIKETAVEFKF